MAPDTPETAGFPGWARDGRPRYGLPRFKRNADGRLWASELELPPCPYGFMALLCIARPSDEEKARAAHILRNVDALTDAARAGIDLEKCMASHPDPLDGRGKRQADHVDGP